MEHNELERYGTVNNWSQELGISWPLMEKRLKSCPAVTGRDFTGQIQEEGYYAESDVRERCADLLQALPVTDDDGFYLHKGETENARYGTSTAWARELGLATSSIGRSLSKVEGIEGRDKGNRKRILYEEAKVRVACAELLADLPQVDTEGFLTIDAVRHAALDTWSRVFQVGFTTLQKRLEKAEGIRARDRRNHSHMVYAEMDVRSVIALELAELPQADEEGFIAIDGKR